MRKCIDEDFLNLKKREISFVDSIGKSKLVKTIVDGINTQDINRVSKLIIASNPNVMIEKVCYQENGKRLIFFADRMLDISAYKEQKQQLVSKKGKNNFAGYLYSAFRNCDEIKVGEVSLSDMALIYENKAREFKERIDNYKSIITSLLQMRGKYSFCNFVDFNYNTSVLTLGIDRKHKYRFRINKCKIEHLDENLAYLDEEILEIYRIYMDYQNYCRSESLGLESNNTKFFIDLNMLGFRTYLKDSKETLFQINYDAFSNYFDYHMYQTNFGKNKFVDANYMDFLNYIYVDISSLPIWLQQEILGVKKEELNNKKGFLASAREFIKRIRRLF